MPPVPILDRPGHKERLWPLSVEAYHALGESGLMPAETELLYGFVFNKIKYEGWYYVEVFEEKAMSREIAKYKGEGFEPSYIYKNAGAFTAVFVNPGQLPQARKLLDELGIGPATVKK